MPKDWKEISDDELLNFDGPQTAEIARYERIMQQRSINAVYVLGNYLAGVTETINHMSKGVQERADNLFSLYDKISRSQTLQQRALFVLSFVVAVSTVIYTCITWQSVEAMREANEIQKQLLVSQKSAPLTEVVPNTIPSIGPAKKASQGSEFKR